MPLDDPYIHLTNSVLVANFYGELITTELIAQLIANSEVRSYNAILARQLFDEARHANMTRALMMRRGSDPMRDYGPEEFTFLSLFNEFSTRPPEETLAFLGENERVSSRNFKQLIRIAKANGDTELAGLYDEILNDEINHATTLLTRLPDNPVIHQVRQEAREKMKKAFNWRYASLFLFYPPSNRADPTALASV